MALKKLKNEIKELRRKLKDISYGTVYHNQLAYKLQGIRQTIEAIESLCEKESDGLEVYENRHDEGKGDGIWINCLDLIEIKNLLKLTNRGR